MNVLRLYPPGQQQCEFDRLYLGLNLHRQASAGDVLIYTNFIASVDGRIALPNPDSGEFGVPGAIANKRDWRLYQELAAQADVLLVSGRYFRQLARGQAQDLLPLGREPEYADLHDWRRQQQLSPQPALLILTNSLDIPLEALEIFRDRRVMVLTGADANSRKRQQLEMAGAEVLVSGIDEVGGLLVRQMLIEQGFRSAYAIAGPQLYRTLVADRVLDYLFLTTHFSLLGGDSFQTMLQHDIHGPVALELKSAYLDQRLPASQIYACYTLHSD